MHSTEDCILKDDALSVCVYIKKNIKYINKNI